jgi:hypothetical protein
MRKSFQMATVFTGAAACAAAFAPTASAVTARTAPAVRAGAAVARAAAAVPARTGSKDCNAGTKTWVHVYFPAGADHGPVCFGGRGAEGVNSVTLVGVCGGNNSGYIFGYSTDHGAFWGIPYGHGTGERNFSKWSAHGIHVGGDLRVTEVSISGFRGGDTCPQ